MNTYGMVILATLLLSYLCEVVASYLNLSALQKPVPEEFGALYDPEKYRQSQAYTQARTRFGLFSMTFDLLLLLGFWFAGGFEYLDQLVRSLGFNSVITGLLYMGALMTLKAVIGIPFSLYATFVLESRFGFNKTTAATFWLDQLKGTVLAVLIGGAILGSVLAFFDYAGPQAWWYCWLTVAGISLILQFIAPGFILPLFNKFTPLEEGSLRQRIMRFAERVDYPLSNLFVMDGSRRSSKSNAFFTGFGKHKRIALFDTLIEKHSERELVAILAHEIGHYKKGHIRQSMIISLLYTGVMFFLLSVFLSHRGLFDTFFMTHMSTYAGLIFFGMLFKPINLVLSVLMQMLSRKNEYEADRFAVESTEDPESMINALKKLSADNLANLTPHPFHVFLNYSHPPLVERVRAIRNFAETSLSGASGLTGVQSAAGE
ncbi:MAG TPA: M48 family metallopeptidase [Calditrichia bacterium]|nr:M48 family metallopeptidase [Calditrichia bacterium]